MSTELPNSAIIVLQSLASNGPMTPKSIIGQIDLPSRTITFALRVLLEEKIVKRVPNLADMRQPFYHVNTEKVKELQIMFNVDRVAYLRPDIRQGNHQGSTFSR
jgi:DNA-binding MarR family transcriptional regulator